MDYWIADVTRTSIHQSNNPALRSVFSAFFAFFAVKKTAWLAVEFGMDLRRNFARLISI
jgi:hypothetical protein